MPDRPSIGNDDDRRMAQALHSGDADALAQIYDAYAARLYDYCHALLRDEESAAYALHDTLIAAQAHIGRLRRPEQFRGWLYTLARNDCLRRISDPERPPERNEASESDDAFLSAEERDRRQEYRELIHSALAGLSGRQREAVDLMYRHGLDPAALAGVLGISPEQATELATETRAQLDDGLSAALIARDSHGECPSVSALVDSRDWPLAPAACRKLIRHTRTCPTCSERRDHRLSAVRLLQVLPVALMPADLLERMFTTATSPEFARERAEIAAWAEPFDGLGWPVPVDNTPRREGRTGGRAARLWPAFAAAACVLLLVGAGFVLLPRSPDASSRGGSSPEAAAPDVSEPASVEPSELESESPEPTPTPTTTSPTPTPSTTRPTPTPTRRPSTRPTTKRPTVRPEPGTLAVGGCNVNEDEPCRVTVAAQGGTVNWSVAGTSPGVTASGGGTLANGESDTISVGLPECQLGDNSDHSGSVTFSPGGVSATVSWDCGPF
ncbi:RNA polymerase sigma factor [Actinomadura alba]|uniref:Sigma-70 family RNA polymerase sigma factor n=1 Tax=Actinomadura alba TaxID=406431 RepID=A0ABR7LVK9_9ACTN|nr:sigma-70 family RNA polymerase sigma factor [Actinomadura alba]MBC6468831.1 sigma-70 family RNA polymerase sigma factor [Actinomadura alba]